MLSVAWSLTSGKWHEGHEDSKSTKKKTLSPGAFSGVVDGIS
jgi:hypothetical protein